jgi:hypothetical protein
MPKRPKAKPLQRDIPSLKLAMFRLRENLQFHIGFTYNFIVILSAKQLSNITKQLDL